MAIKNYKELIVWNKTRTLVSKIYKVTADFPRSELYGLCSQIRRCVISIGANIAEGYSRGSRRESAHFVTIAFGSATELEALPILSADLEFISNQTANTLIDDTTEILKMLNKLTNSLKNPKSTKP